MFAGWGEGGIRAAGEHGAGPFGLEGLGPTVGEWRGGPAWVAPAGGPMGGEKRERGGNGDPGQRKKGEKDFF